MDKLWKALEWFVLTILLALYAYTCLGIYKAYMRRHPDPTYIVPRKIVKTMAFHGALDAFLDYKGRVYFIRNGQKIYLKAGAGTVLPVVPRDDP
jgi:hypothetical protein